MNIPMILSVGAVNSHLVKLGLRGYCSINVETSETLDTHSFAVLIGVGATTINPYLIIDWKWGNNNQGVMKQNIF